MATLLSIFGTLIGIATVMLAASLVVMSLVQMVLFLADSRGKTLGENLGSLNQGFRFNAHDSVAPGDAPRLQFVLDVLTYPALHDSSTLSLLTAKGPRPEKLLEQQAKVARQVEYLAEKDLLAIVRSMLEGKPNTESEHPDDERPLPARWSAQLAPADRTYRAFRLYVEHWYKTLEGVASEQFKIKARRLTAALSCVLVVVLNLDGIQLATDLFKSTAAQEALRTEAPAVLQRAQALGVTNPSPSVPADRGALLDGTSQTIRQMNGVLSEPELHFGWQNSWIVKRWCNDEGAIGKCGSFDQLASLDTLRWLFGLGFSCLLLSLGAPFWAKQLSGLLNFQNSVQQALGAGKIPESDDNQSRKPRQDAESDDKPSRKRRQDDESDDNQRRKRRQDGEGDDKA